MKLKTSGTLLPCHLDTSERGTLCGSVLCLIQSKRRQLPNGAAPLRPPAACPWCLWLQTRDGVGCTMTRVASLSCWQREPNPKKTKPNPVEVDDFGGLSCTCTEADVAREGMTSSRRLMMLAVNGDVKLLSTALGLGCRIHPALPENLRLLFL